MLNRGFTLVAALCGATLMACGGEEAPKISCTDNLQNGSETDVDCGGTCGLCEGAEGCATDADCAGVLFCDPEIKLCTDNCTDARTDADESDIDCGGSCAPCGNGMTCNTDDDCGVGLLCGAGGLCEFACLNGIQDQDETDVDCGGDTCTQLCGEGEGCGKTEDCYPSLTCVGGVCDNLCRNGVLDAGETDVDCGGSFCPLCLAGETCGAQSDCEKGLTCSASLFICEDLCQNGAQDGGETAVDCGGPTCKRCVDGETCSADNDCFSGNCATTCTTSTAALTEVELCAVYQNYYVDEFTNLCQVAPQHTGLDYADYALAYNCRPGTDGYKWAERLVEAHTAQRVTIDWATAQQCLTNSRRLRSGIPADLPASSEWASLKDGACKTFFTSNVAPGAACKDEWDCDKTGGDYGCYTTDPRALSFTCIAKSAVGGDCGDYLECAAGAICNYDTSKCEAATANGGDCSANADCTSNYCSAQGLCAASPTKGIGETCSTADECMSDCASCRSLTEGAAKTCQVLGGEGAYCSDWLDCAYDLGCTDHVCTGVGRNQLCGPNSGGWCRAGYYCIPFSDCTANSYEECSMLPGCAFDDYEGCYQIEGICTSVPESGPCYQGYCADGFYCDATDNCVALGVDGDFCDDETAFCREDLVCDYALSACGHYECEYNEDCLSTEYCGNDYTCETAATTTCDGSVPCAGELTCMSGNGICGRYDSSTCAANSGCAMGVECYSECWTFGDDYSGCTAAGCTWDDYYGCFPSSETADQTCADHGASAADCTATAGCYAGAVACVATTGGMSGTCNALLPVGELCNQWLEGSDCESGNCLVTDVATVYKCALPYVEGTDGCGNVHNSDFLRLAFLFGMVWTVGVRRLRRKDK